MLFLFFAIEYISFHSHRDIMKPREHENVRRPISRVLSAVRGPLDDHSSGTFVTECLARSTRVTARNCPADKPPRHPYSILLPVRFAMPSPLPETRCALTAPFHPYRSPKEPCSPTGEFGGLLSVALSLGSPPPGVTRHRFSVEPGLSSRAVSRKTRPQRSSSRLTPRT